MRKLRYLCLISSAILSLMTCDLFNPGLGKGVDLEPPLLTLTSHQNGAYVKGTITITGTYNEDRAVASIEVSFDNGLTFLPATIDEQAKSWSLQFDTTTVADGERDVIFRITDATGKKTDKKVLFNIDNTSPIAMMTTPSVYGASTPAYYGSAFTIRGEAADLFGIAGVQIQIWSQDNNTLLATLNANGTSTWSCTFNSTTYVPATGTLNFRLIATDRAGNTSIKFYHYSDIWAANGYTNIVIDDIYKYYTGQPGYTSGPVYNFLQANGTSPIPLYFDQDYNKPIIEIYNPDNSGAENNIFTSTSRLSGKAIDEDGIKENSVEVRIKRSGTGETVIDWTSTNNEHSPSVSWSYVLPGAPPMIDGNYTLEVRASDIDGNTRTSAPVAFKIDSGAPTLTVDQPTQGQYINGNFTISGTAVDSNGIKRVEISLDDGQTWPYTATLSYPNWSYDITNPTEGAMLIKVRAIENTVEEKKSTYNLQVVIDKTAPSVSFLNPPLSATVNGLVLIRGTSSDNTQITNVELRIGIPNSYIQMTNMYNWEYQIDSASYANDTFAYDMGSGVWKLYIYARVTDRAGNITNKTDYYFLIDNDTDKPVVNILAPQNGAVIGGSTVVSGTAIDDDGLYKIYMRMDLDNDGYYTSQYNLNGNGVTGGSQIGTVAGLPIGDPAELFEKEAFWYELSGTTQWTVELNKNGELYHINGQNGEITIQVVAVDSKDGGLNPDIKGNYQQISFRFDDTIPGFQNMSHDSSSHVRKTFTLSGRAVDDQQVNKIEISYNGGVNWTTIATPNTTPYDFNVNINTETINGGVFANSSGILYLRLKATDNTGYTKLQIIDLRVDNKYPTGQYTIDSSDIYGSAANSKLQGQGYDEGTVSGVEKIELYFTRGTGPYNLYSPKGTTPNPKTVDTYYDFGDGSGVVPYVSAADKANYVITIDKLTELGNDSSPNGDGDGYNESLTVFGSTYNWWAEFNSLNISDGSITIHYVVFDKAGNGHHYTQDGFIKNYKPTISSVTVGSDLDMNGSVDPSERWTYTGSFKARNRIYFGINASDSGPNAGIAQYRVFHPDANGTIVQTTQTGTLDISGYSEGATSFLVRITDNDGITREQTLNVIIDNIDDIAPTITLYPLAQTDRTSDLVTGGHIELDGESLFNGSDPDVSGTIILRGHAHDDQRIQYLKITITGQIPTETTIASWPQTNTPGTYGNLTISNVTLTESGGHDFDFTYTWNTALVPNQAGTNISVTFKVEDFKTPTPASATASRSHDVVPYITKLVRGLGEELTIRSKYGKYPVQTGETNFYIYGYNLAKTGTNWVRVYNTAGSAYDEIPGAKITVNGTNTLYTVSNLSDVTHSGFLRLMVNGIEAGNYGNNNSLLYNKEDDGNGIYATLWTDDRYLQVWQTGSSFNQSTQANYPSMSIGTDGTLYGAWTDYTTAESVFYGTTSARTAIFRQYDPAEYTDIHVDSSDNITVAFLANFYGGQAWTPDVDAAGSIAVYNGSAPIQFTYSGFSNRYYRFEMLYRNQMLWQFQRPKVVRSGNNIHLAYYDINTSSLKYGYVVNGATNASEIRWLNIDGGSDGDDNLLVSGTATARPNQTTLTDTALIGNSLIAVGQNIWVWDNNGNYGQTTISAFNSGTGQITLSSNINTAWTHYTIQTSTSCLVTQGVSRSSSAGTYLSIDVDEQGYPVIVYYDVANQTLRLARANSVTPNMPANWFRQTVFKTDDPYRTFVGHYNTIKFDTTGKLYVASYRTSTGDLIYLEAPDADGTDYTFGYATAVDTVGSVGSWADITLNNTIPYISYLNSSMIGTFAGLKLAYYDTSRGAWEYMVVPCATPVTDNRTNIEWKKGSVSWSLAIGYKGSAFDIVYLLPEE